MFLLNALLDLTPEPDVFCRSFATQNASVSLHSILTYQINFLHPTPVITFSIPPATHRLFRLPPLLLGSQQ